MKSLANVMKISKTELSVISSHISTNLSDHILGHS